MNPRQAILDELQLSPQDAISLAVIPTATHGVKPVSARMQRRLLQFLASFSSDKCWLSTANMAQRLNHTERTIRVTLRVLVKADLVIESGPRNRRVRAVHWTEVGRRVPRMNQQNDPVNLAVQSGQFVSSGPVQSGQFVSSGPVQSGQFVSSGPVHPVRRDRIQNVKEKEQTTTTKEPEGVVVVLRTLAKGELAVRLARERGLTDAAIGDLHRAWLALPEDERLEGKLFNWLAYDGSYRKQSAVASGASLGRGDGLNRDQVAIEAMRFRMFRAGQAAGASHAEIEQRIREAELRLQPAGNLTLEREGTLQ